MANAAASYFLCRFRRVTCKGGSAQLYYDYDGQSDNLYSGSKSFANGFKCQDSIRPRMINDVILDMDVYGP